MHYIFNTPVQCMLRGAVSTSASTSVTVCVQRSVPSALCVSALHFPVLRQESMRLLDVCLPAQYIQYLRQCATSDQSLVNNWLIKCTLIKWIRKKWTYNIVVCIYIHPGDRKEDWENCGDLSLDLYLAWARGHETLNGSGKKCVSNWLWHQLLWCMYHALKMI